ncbi:UbiA family prenyltransferase, partial [Micromonospora sp. CV4]|uniref:UbiA family prenyltransferase n=1 Tax=Micromonospora sp. CV4 TaxID=2478711 RepID=UPI001F194257
MTTLADLAELVRAPAALSVPGDVVAGAAAAGALNRRTPALAGASVLLYWAGMAANDWADRRLDAVERPERPIPSGRVAPAAAFGLAAGLTAAVLPLADTGHRAAALIGFLVSAALSAAGLRRLPGRTRPSARLRLRHLIEATGPAVGLALAAWLLLPRDVLPAPTRLVAALGLGGLG